MKSLNHNLRYEEFWIVNRSPHGGRLPFLSFQTFFLSNVLSWNNAECFSFEFLSTSHPIVYLLFSLVICGFFQPMSLSETEHNISQILHPCHCLVHLHLVDQIQQLV